MMYIKLIDFLIKSCNNLESAEWITSIFAIRNDFCMIIASSIGNVGKLFSKSMPQTKNFFVSETSTVPNTLLTVFALPDSKDFEANFADSNKIQVYVKYFPFELPVEPGSQDCINFLESVLQCQNKEILSSLIVQEFIDYQFDLIKIWIIIYSLLIILVIFSMMMLIGLGDNIYFICIFLVSNCIIFLWETFQLFTSPKDYFQDFWNYIDMSRLILSLVWLFYLEEKLDYLEIAVITLNFFRGLSAFRVIDGTRYYIRLILKSTYDIRYFIFVFFYSNLMIGCLYSARSTNELTFKSIWYDMFCFNFGYFNADSLTSPIDYGLFMYASIINIVIMLNLLISILGDTHEEFQLERNDANYIEKIEMCLEVQRLNFWKRNMSDKKFLQVIQQVGGENNDENWEGRIVYLENKIECAIENVQNLDSKLINQVAPNLVKCISSMKDGIVHDLNARIDEVKNCIETSKGSNKTKDAENTENDDEESNETKNQNKINEIESKLEDIKRNVDDFKESLSNRLEKVEVGIAKILEKLDR